jgi:hypothetical protein
MPTTREILPAGTLPADLHGVRGNLASNPPQEGSVR